MWDKKKLTKLVWLVFMCGVLKIHASESPVGDALNNLTSNNLPAPHPFNMGLSQETLDKMEKIAQNGKVTVATEINDFEHKLASGLGIFIAGKCLSNVFSDKETKKSDKEESFWEQNKNIFGIILGALLFFNKPIINKFKSH